MGRPTLYDPGKLVLVEGWARDGLSNEQIAEKLGIHVDTLYEWRKVYPEFSDALKKGKDIVDREVENGLLKKTTGYTVELRKTFKVKTIDYSESGKKLREYEELVVGIDEVHIPADTTAQIFWLKNRKPDQWRDKQEVGIGGKNGEPLTIILSGEAKEWAR